MSKQGLFKKLSFMLAFALVMTSLWVPAMAETAEKDAAEVNAEDPGILRTGDEIREVDGFYYQWVDPDDDYSYDARIVGYKNAEGDGLTVPNGFIIEDSEGNEITCYFTEIGDRAFKNKTGLEGMLTLPEKLESIGEEAFSGCAGFTELNISGNSLIIFGSKAFQGCTGIKKVTSNTYFKFSELDEDGGETHNWLDENGKKIESFDISGGVAYRDDYEYTEYQVTFDNNGGDDGVIIPSQSVRENGKATKPGKEPVKGGCVFTGWFRDKNGKEEFDFDKIPITADITLYAGWKANEGDDSGSDDKDEYTVTFNSNGGDGDEVFASQTVEKNKMAAEPEEKPKRTGYKFICWCTDKEGENPYDFASEVTADLTLYAAWEKTEGGSEETTKVIKDTTEGSTLWFTVNEDGKSATIFLDEKGVEPGFVVEEHVPLKDADMKDHYGEDGEDLAIPGTVKDKDGKEYIVTAIGDRAFMSRNYTGKLTFPESVTKIGERAFYFCSSLSDKLTIPKNVKSIGKEAFLGCSNLTGLGFDGSSLEVIREGAFSGCIKLEGDLILPDSVLTIEKEAFNDCTGIKGKLYLGKSLTVIGESAFSGVKGTDRMYFTGDLVIPDTVTTIEERAFNECQSLDGKLFLGKNIRTIGKRAFGNCNSLHSPDTGFVMPDTLEMIGEGAFASCKSLTGDLTVKAPTVMDSAFQNCSGFGDTLTIEKSVTKLGGDDSLFDGDPSSIFIGCTGIKRVLNNSELEIPLVPMNERAGNNPNTWRDGSGNAITVLKGKGTAYRDDYQGTVSEDSVSDNKPHGYKFEPRDMFVIGYSSVIPFFGKAKIVPSLFGENFVVQYGGASYKVSKIKVNKKKKTIQVTGLEGVPDKKIVRAVKKATKGAKGLPYKVNPYWIKEDNRSDVEVKVKKGRVKSVKITIQGKKYKAKREKEWSFDPANNLITFKGENLAGSYKIQ